MDPLRIGMGWSVRDLSKPQILLESAYGDSHPGSAHLNEFVFAAERAVKKNGGKAAKYYATDICDGQAQGHDGMNVSLASREIIAALIEIHATATPFDAGVFFASCDKSVPAHLQAIARLPMPALFFPGGVMPAGPNLLTLERIGTYSARLKRGEISKTEFERFQRAACPSCGACSFMGTAATMQIMAEALGIALPGSALLPAKGNALKRYARMAGERAVALAKERLLPKDIMTKEAFHNAVVVHAAIGGSSNALLHLPAIARELNIDVDAEFFDRTHRTTPYLVNIRPSGTWPAECFAYAGGVPAVMEEVKARLHLDVMTVTGKTLGENLSEIKKNGVYGYARKGLKKYGIKKEDVIRPFDAPLREEGAVAILKGNLAPEGAVIKHSALPNEMRNAKLVARPFNGEEDAMDAIINGRVNPGDAVIIRYEGPKGSGMPELFYATEAIASDKRLSKDVALITDGRFSGATRGPAIGHVSPEAQDGGAIALVEEGDIILLDIERRSLAIIGTNGKEQSREEIDAILARRRAEFVPKPRARAKGVLGAYMQYSASPMKGGYFE